MEIIHARPTRLVISNALILAFSRTWCAGDAAAYTHDARVFHARSTILRGVNRRSSVWIRRKLRLLLLKGSPIAKDYFPLANLSSFFPPSPSPSPPIRRVT